MFHLVKDFCDVIISSQLSKFTRTRKCIITLLHIISAITRNASAGHLILSVPRTDLLRRTVIYRQYWFGARYLLT